VPSPAAAAEPPACVVRPEQTEGPALLAMSRQADQRGTIGVTLTPIESASATLLAMLP
jgi:hypothetical protein